MRQTRSQGSEGLLSGDTPQKLPHKRGKPADEHPVTVVVQACAPTQREIAAAEAARARLCGGRGQTQAVQSDELPTGTLPTGVEPASVEVEYTVSADLQALSNPDEQAQAIASLLAAKHWVEAISALNILRQLLVHHPDTIRPSLAVIVPLVLTSVKSLRSVQAKTAIMACTDMFCVLQDEMLPHLNVGGAERPATSLLAQLLLKLASNDKRFVIEEAVLAAEAMASNVDSAAMLEMLMPYVRHKNPKVRGKAARVCVAAAKQLDLVALSDFGLERLLAAAGALVTDNTPDARAAAKQLLPLVRTSFVASAGISDESGPVNDADGATQKGGATRKVTGAGLPRIDDTAGQPEERTAWETFVHENTSASAAIALLKI